VNLAALVLAAGAGNRFGGGKLAARFRDEPLIDHAVRTALASPANRVIVVAAPGLTVPDGVEVLRVESLELAESLKAGISAAGPVDGLFVFLGDMPLVPQGVAAQLALNLGAAYAAQPRWRGKPGHPVLLSPRAIADAAGLHGDQGAGRLLRDNADTVYLDCSDEGVVIDVDRPDDLARLE